MTKQSLIPNILTVDDFKKKLDDLVESRPIKIWLAKSVHGRLDTVFSVGEAQGMPIRHFDHIGGFYLLGENIPREMIDTIHDLFVLFCQANFTAHRLERHFVDTRFRSYYDGGKRYREEMLMHVPLSVHGPTEQK